MAPTGPKRRRAGDDEPRKPKKKIRIKQKSYHSSSEDEDENEDQITAQDAPAQTSFSSRKVEAAPKAKSILKSGANQKPLHSARKLNESKRGELARNTTLNMAPQSSSEDDEDEDDEDGDHNGVRLNEESASENDSYPEEEGNSESETNSQASSIASKKKRNDPTAFATSISKILDTKLTAAKRADPVLSRSKSAAEANKVLADGRLEQQARAQMRAEKKVAMEKGRVKDVLGLELPDVDTGAIMETEMRLKKTAQRGVIKLFNAVRAAQVKAEQGMREARAEGVVGMKQREERVNEMSKQGFLDLISSGGKKTAAAVAG